MYTLKIGRVRLAADEFGGVDIILGDEELESAYARETLEDKANHIADLLKLSETNGEGWWWDGRADGREVVALWIEE